MGNPGVAASVLEILEDHRICFSSTYFLLLGTAKTPIHCSRADMPLDYPHVSSRRTRGRDVPNPRGSTGGKWSGHFAA